VPPPSSMPHHRPTFPQCHRHHHGLQSSRLHLRLDRAPVLTLRRRSGFLHGTRSALAYCGSPRCGEGGESEGGGSAFRHGPTYQWLLGSLLLDGGGGGTWMEAATSCRSAQMGWHRTLAHMAFFIGWTRIEAQRGWCGSHIKAQLAQGRTRV
jgi:hypothetical protein